MQTVAVFCGSKPGTSPAFLQWAKKAGEVLAHNDLALVYGGAHSGLMGALADAALEAGGEVIGVMPDNLEKQERIHQGISQLISVKDMSERKEKMLALSDGCIALPGGTGTLDEIFEAITLSQLGVHKKPCAFLNIEGFYDPLHKFLQHAQDQGFIHPDYFDMLIFSDDLQNMLSRMRDFKHPHQY